VWVADRAAGLQFLQLALDRDGIDVRLEASFAMAGLGMEPVRLEQDLGAWRTEGTRKGVAMTGAATLRLGGEPLVAERPFSLRWAGRWRSVAGQGAEFDRPGPVARADTPEHDPAPSARRDRARCHRICARRERRRDRDREHAGHRSSRGDHHPGSAAPVARGLCIPLLRHRWWPDLLRP